MTDYKQLCTQLLEAYEILLGELRFDNRLAKRTRAALAEPEPEVPTDEEIMELMSQQMRDDLAAAARALSGFDPDNVKAASVFRIILNRHSVDHARAVLARWGNHPESPDSSTQPIPVSERLPGAEDCDAKGRCWAWKLDDEDDAWHLELKEWINSPWTTHWLPAHVLSQPS